MTERLVKCFYRISNFGKNHWSQKNIKKSKNTNSKTKVAGIIAFLNNFTASGKVASAQSCSLTLNNLDPTGIPWLLTGDVFANEAI